MISLLEKAVILAAVVALLGLAPLAAIRITDAWGWPHWHPPGSRIIGGAMVVFAAGVWGHCSLIFARLGKGTPFITDPPKRLVTGGLYRYSRNPLYVAHVTFLLGWCVASGRLALLLYAAGVAASFQAVIVLREEPALRALFGEDYVRYSRIVPRWLPLRPSRWMPAYAVAVGHPAPRSRRSPRFEEPLRRTLARNVTIAAIVGVVLASRRGDPKLVLPMTVLALWFSLGGHYVELAFLNGVRTRLPQRRPTQVLARLLVWSGGGALLYACMVATARALPIHASPVRLWCSGSVLFIGLELVVHAVLALRGLPSFFNGRG